MILGDLEEYNFSYKIVCFGGGLNWNWIEKVGKIGVFLFKKNIEYFFLFFLDVVWDRGENEIFREKWDKVCSIIFFFK